MIPPFKVSTAMAGIQQVRSSPAQAAGTAPANSKFAKALAAKQEEAAPPAPKNAQEAADAQGVEAFKASFKASCSTLPAGVALDQVDG